MVRSWGLYTPPHHVDPVSWYEKYERTKDDAPDYSMLSYLIIIKDIANYISVNVYSIKEVTQKKKKRFSVANEEPMEWDDEQDG